MKPLDILTSANSNLVRSKLRTTLTILAVLALNRTWIAS
jgi:hypothetical protein